MPQRDPIVVFGVKIVFRQTFLNHRRHSSPKSKFCVRHTMDRQVWNMEERDIKVQKTSYLLIVVLLMVTWFAFAVRSAEAITAAVSTWAAIKNGDAEENAGTVRLAPSRLFGRRNVWADGYIHADGPSEGSAQSPEWGDILAEIGNSLDRSLLDELAAAPEAGVDVEVQDLSGNPITQIKRGNPIEVHGTFGSAGPLKSTCIVVLPVNSPDYKEILLQLREYSGTAGGIWFYFYIPNWTQIEGKAIIIVKVNDMTGFATLTVLP